MKSIKPAEKTILSLITQKVPEQGTIMKRSMFVLAYTINGKLYLFHTLSRECFEYDGNRIDDMIRIDHPDEQLEYLITHRFYVNENADECQTYCSIISMLRMIKSKKGYSTYTILPTTLCNARCFYCYEQDYEFTSMKHETVSRLIRFIQETHCDEEIHLRWFGGEPLLGRNTIDQICSALKEMNIPFDSSIVTNGCLLDEETVTKAASLWNVRDIQITLDGDEEEYNRRKNYISFSSSAFQKVIDGIRLSVNAGIRIQLRLNMDYENMDSIASLADHLDQLLNDKSNILIYVHPLFFLEMSSSCSDIWQRCMEMEDLFAEKGFNTYKTRGTKPLPIYYCIASNPSSILIGADGLLYTCEHFRKEHYSGTMDQPITTRKKAFGIQDVTEKCRSCPFLPDCTEFHECPDSRYNCRSVREIQLIHTLKNLTE